MFQSLTDNILFFVHSEKSFFSHRRRCDDLKFTVTATSAATARGMAFRHNPTDPLAIALKSIGRRFKTEKNLLTSL